MNPNTTRKERDLSSVIYYPPIQKTDGKGVNTESTASTRTFKGRQVTVSEGHRKNPRTGKYDSGGPFFTYRIEPHVHARHVKMDVKGSGSIRRKYSGPITIPISSSGYSGFSAPGEDSSYLDPVGATAISIIDPTNPNAQTGVALGEIIHDKRISLPGIQSWRRRTEVAKAAGSEYLAAVFGWLPLVSDVKNTSQSIRDANTIIKNYRAASGTLVHREFAFDDIVSTEEAIINTSARCSYSSQVIDALFSGSPTVLAKRRDSTTKRWFSGSFTYSATDASSVGRCLGVESEIDKLFGLTLTPDVMWELTPWSWAIDWFSNAGDVIKNTTNFALAGLVMKYGFIMEETTITDTYSMPATGLTGVTGPPPDASVTQVIKRRRPANPFGFGLTWEGLSPTQLAIAAALGITRLR